ncbi:MAG TPA: HPF/RaiA family ribosome-associated protein [Gemmatimonadales bacterium]|jgi:putative sigma-54 modulation protein|nr:HPF/RaiA family ribosome-associated protein [Gemmatimonadales bacterium]
MKIRIRSTSSVTDGLRGHIGRRLNSALARFRGHVDDVQVRLSDVNGPRGGVDKRCRLVLSASRGDVLVAEGRAPNFYQAVDLATNRAARSVRRVSAAPHTMRRSA